MTAEQIQWLGWSEEDEAPVGVWPDNDLAVRLFFAMRRQWRCHSGGFYGLDYGAIPVVLPGLGLQSLNPELLTSLQVMENAALELMQEDKD